MKTIRLFPLQNPVKVEIPMPGSKSYTNRALILAAMTKGVVKIINPLFCDDTAAMINCLKKLGIQINIEKELIEVVGSIHDVKNKRHELDANLSGTTLRFILALLTIVPGIKILAGKEGLHKRPVKELVDALDLMGAKIEYLKNEGCPPLRIISSRLRSGEVILNGDISSQFLSALLMISPLIGNINIKVRNSQVSAPYIDMTLDIMKKFSVAVQNKEYKEYAVAGRQEYKIKQYVVAGDFSTAGYFLAIAALTKSTLTLKNLKSDSLQGDRKIIDVLEQMGNVFTIKENEVTIKGVGVRPISVNMIDFPDQAQTLAVLEAFANGKTELSGLQSLHIKETDRLKALKQELSKMQIKTSSTFNRLIIYGGQPKKARIDTYEDHRMAMAFAIAGAKLSGMEINDPDVVSKTCPEFWEKLNSMGIKTELFDNRNIVLIGMRGSGKTTIGKLLSKKLKRNCLELDDVLAKKMGMSISSIVKNKRWKHFREKESEIVIESSILSNKIISTGGGVIVKDENIEYLKKNGVIIFLDASAQTLMGRTKNDPERPALTNKKIKSEEVKQLLKERKNIYLQAAHMVINTDAKDPDQVAKEIIFNLRRKNI